MDTINHYLQLNNLHWLIIKIWNVLKTQKATKQLNILIVKITSFQSCNILAHT
jgi:hypothetical protein